MENNQTILHEKILRQILDSKDYGDTNAKAYISINGGILCHRNTQEETYYKISIRNYTNPDFYLDSSTFAKLKKLKKAYYIVIENNTVFIFDINKYKYESKTEFANVRTDLYTKKTHKKVRVFQKWQRIDLIEGFKIPSLNTQYVKKEEKKTNCLFQ